VIRVWTNLPDWAERRQHLTGRSIGFVPTMGALHRGHASLVERSRADNEITVVSIFVNPSQFNEAKDLERYPRTMETDVALLKDLGVDDVVAPSAAEVYPHGYDFRVEPPARLAALMEGSHRPGFLQGVCTIVLKLFSLVRADRSYFGEKDYQQLKTIEGMVKDLFIPTEIVPCPTVREASGLAMSSRNMLLSIAARGKAASIYRALSNSPTSGDARGILQSEGFEVDYVEEHWGRRFAAAYLEGVRLIDNVPLAKV
jgi:pantoate--beta-alanine ligase